MANLAHGRGAFHCAVKRTGGRSFSLLREWIRGTNLEMHFEISARVGDENTVARDVRAYLGANEINACAK